LVGHNDQIAFGGIFVSLELVVLGIYTGAASEEEQELRGRMGVV
jgi:hypothetical protein